MTDTISRKIVSTNILCTILIVCLHARYEYNGVYNIIGTLSDIAVPVFFAISSYLYFEKFDWNNPITSYKKGIKRTNNNSSRLIDLKSSDKNKEFKNK